MIVHDMHIVILNVYVAPYTTLSNKLHIRAKSLCNIHSNQTIVIVGEFNINTLERNNKTNKLRSYMYNYNLYFLLDTNRNAQVSIIAHITYSYKSFRPDTYSTNHDTICLIIENKNVSNGFTSQYCHTYLVMSFLYKECR